MALGTYSDSGLGFGLSFFLEDLFSGPASAIESSMRGMENTAKATTRNIDQSFNHMQRGIGLALTGIATMVPVGLGLKVAGEFEQMEVGLTTLLKSAEAARDVMNQVKKDARATPYDTTQLLDAQRMMIATGMGAEKAREDVMALANALAATGKLDALQRMTENMMQVKNLGVASKVDIKQFQRVFPLDAIVGQALGIDQSKVQELTLTYDQIAFALQRARKEGGMFYNALENQSKTLLGSLSNLVEGFQFTMAAMGKALFDIAKPAILVITSWMDSLAQFAETGVGQVVLQFASLSLVLVGLGIIVAGLKMAFVGLAGAMAPLWPIIAVGIALVGIFVLIKKSLSEFDAVAVGTAKRGEGLTLFLQRVGGVFKGLYELMTNFNLEDYTSKMSKTTADALKKLGILELVVNLGTYFARLRVMINSFWQTFRPILTTIGNVMMFIYNAVKLVTGGIAKMIGGITNSKTPMSEMIVLGKLLAYIFGGLLLISIVTITLALGLLAVTLGPVVLGVYLLYEAIRYVGQALGFVINSVITLIQLFRELFSLGASDAFDNFGTRMAANAAQLVGEGTNAKLKLHTPDAKAAGADLMWQGIEQGQRELIKYDRNKVASPDSKVTEAFLNKINAAGMQASGVQTINLVLDKKVISTVVTGQQNKKEAKQSFGH